MSELTNQQRKDLTDKIKDGYNLDEMGELCRNLGIESEYIVGVGATRAEFAERLVGYFERRKRLDELIEQVRQDRPRLFDDESIIEANNFDGDSYVGTTSSSSGGSFFDFYGWLPIILPVIACAFLTWGGVWYISYQQRNPQTFIRTYYGRLQSNEYSAAWGHTSGDYRINKYPQGYDSYADYYRNFAKLEILKSEIQEQGANTATVYVFLAVEDVNGIISNREIVYLLSRSGSNAPWLITDSSP